MKIYCVDVNVEGKTATVIKRVLQEICPFDEEEKLECIE